MTLLLLLKTIKEKFGPPAANGAYHRFKDGMDIVAVIARIQGSYDCIVQFNYIDDGGEVIIFSSKLAGGQETIRWIK